MLLREFHRAGLHDFRAEGRHFKKLLVRHFWNFFRVFYYAGVGGINSADVGVYLANVRLHRRRERYCRQVAAAAPEGRDISVAVHPLETRNDDNLAFVEAFFYVAAGNFDNPCAGMGKVRMYSGLGSRAGNRLYSERVESHCRQRYRLLLADCEEHVHFPFVGH